MKVIDWADHRRQAFREFDRVESGLKGMYRASAFGFDMDVSLSTQRSHLNNR